MTPYHRDSWHFLAHSKSIFVTKTQKNTIDVKEYLRVLLHLLLRNSIVERVFIACDGDVIQSVFPNVQLHFPGIAVKWYHLFILQKGNCIHAKCKMHPVAPRSRSFWQCIWARMCDCVCVFFAILHHLGTTISLILARPMERNGRPPSGPHGQAPNLFGPQPFFYYRHITLKFNPVLKTA